MSRQSATGASARERKRCSVCGAYIWLKCSVTGQFTGPWHFQDCPTIPGGAELTVRNSEDRKRWLQEKPVPRPQAHRIMAAIMYMMNAPSKAAMQERRAAILEELATLNQSPGPSGEEEEEMVDRQFALRGMSSAGAPVREKEGEK